MTRAIDEMKMDMTKLRYSLNTQHSKNKLTDMNFDMYQKQTVDAVLEAKKLQNDYGLKLEEMLE